MISFFLVARRFLGIFENAIFSVKMPLAEQTEVRNSPFLVGRTLAGR